MINPKELRIGNYVKSGNGIYTIEALSRDEALAMKSVNHGIIIDATESVIYNPIEISKDWLLKFGFRANENFDWFKNCEWNEYISDFG